MRALRIVMAFGVVCIWMHHLHLTCFMLTRLPTWIKTNSFVPSSPVVAFVVSGIASTSGPFIDRTATCVRLFEATVN